MKKIIKNKVYDTEKARILAEANSCTLYRKKTGEFFLFSGDAIYPKTYDQADAWAKATLPEHVYAKIFGQPEDDSTVQTVITMPASRLAAIKKNAAKRGMTVSAYIADRCTDEGT